MANVILDTRKLKIYADRIEAVNSRIKKLDTRMNKLYFRLPVTELQHLLRADVMTSYSLRLLQCQRYLNDTAKDFEATERRINAKDLSDFYAPDPSVIWGDISGIAGVLIGEQADTLSDWESAGNFLEELERYYDTLSPEWHFIIESFAGITGITEAYNITSGIIQGNLTREDIYDAAVSISGTNVTALAIVEAINFALEKGEELDQEMMDNIMEQLEEWDIVGAVGEGLEGFVDGIIGGSVECLFSIGGNMIDNTIGDIKIGELEIGAMFNEGTEYITGLITGGKYEATLGEMLSDAGDLAFEAIDKTTDVITDVADDIRTGVQKGIEKGVDTVCSWVSSWF